MRTSTRAGRRRGSGESQPPRRSLPGWAGALALVVAGSAGSAEAQTIATRRWSDPQPGVRLLEGTTTSPTTRFYALYADLCADYVHVAATARPSSRRTASAWGSATGVQAAVNGDFYRTDTSTPVVYGQAAGSGSLWPEAQTGEGSSYTGDWYHRRYGWIAFGPDWVDFTHTREVKRAGGVTEGFSPTRATGEVPVGTVSLVSGFPELVTEGRRVTCASPTDPSCFPDRSDMRARHPRTAMGLTSDRRTFLLVVVDGRSTSSAGMYGTELASLMDQLGAWQAFNLDGGGSSQMWVAGRGTINSPSDGSARSVANHWGIFAGTAGGRPRRPGSCLPRAFDDCFREDPEGTSCGELEAILGTGASELGRSSDVNGDGRADLCGRAASGWLCRTSTGEGFAAAAFRLAALSDEAGADDPSRYTTLRMGDLDGDGRADLCVREPTGIRCWRSTGSEWSEGATGPRLDDAGNWNRPMHYTSLRLADVDGDGRDDLCARGFSGVRCWHSTGDGFEEEARDGPRWGNAEGFDEPSRYGTLRAGDVDGDGRADLCARTGGGMECFLSDGRLLSRRVSGPAWSDAEGWGAPKHWSTIRLADVNGDGRADLCGRSAVDLRCHLSEGERFAAEPLVVADLSDANGWGEHDNYATLRVGDVNGDGADDLCARANGGVRCWVLEGDTFRRISGPELSNAAGWNDPRYYSTLRLADVNGDGRADLCARSADGLSCWLSTGDGFELGIELSAFGDASGWRAPQHYASLRLAGPPCRPTEERCDGQDDDCDARIDEGVCVEDGGAPSDDAGAGGEDAGAGGEDAGPGDEDAGARDAPGDRELFGGCGCRVGASERAGPWWVAGLLIGMVGLRRSRRLVRR